MRVVNKSLLILLGIFALFGCSGLALPSVEDDNIGLSADSTIIWEPERDAIGYHVQIAETEEELGKKAIIEVMEPYYRLGEDLLTASTLYWRVRAKTSSGKWGQWSRAYKFSIHAAADEAGKEDKDNEGKDSGTKTGEETSSEDPSKKADGEDKEIEKDGSGNEGREDTGDDTLYINLPEIGSKEWETLMMEIFGRTEESDFSTGEKAYRQIAEYCNSRSSAEGRKPAYSFLAGEVILIPWANGYRIPQEAVWKDKAHKPWPHGDKGKKPFWEHFGWPRGKNEHPDGSGNTHPRRWNSVMSSLSPVDGTTLTSAAVPFSWDPVDDAVGYQIQIWDAVKGRPIALAEVESSSYSYEALPNGAYHWQARAIGPNGEKGKWSKYLSFKKRWGAIRDMVPLDLAKLTDQTPAFSWNEVEGAVKYQLQLIRSRSSSFRRKNIIEMEEPRYTPRKPLNFSQYFWRVRAVDAYGRGGIWSKALSFSIDSLSAVSGLLPEDNAVTYNARQTLSWEPVDGAVKYQLSLASSPNAVDNSAPIDVSSGESYTPPLELPQGVWYWQVRAVSEDETASPWSSSQKFSVSDGDVTLVGPINEIFTFDTTPGFSWNGAVGAAAYRMQIAGDGSELAGAGTIPVDGGMHYTPADDEALEFGLYRWRVQAVDVFGNLGRWSDDWSVNIANSAISGMTPLYSVSDSQVLEMTWNAAPHAAAYEFQLANSKSRLTETGNSVTVSETRYQPSSALNLYEAYFWRVRAIDEAKSPGQWSQTRVVVVYDASQHGGEDNIITLADGTRFSTIEDLEDGYVFVPGGTFMMGKESNQEVTLSAFSISPLEVTHQEFMPFINDSSVEIQFERSVRGQYVIINDVPAFEVGNSHPVNQDSTGNQRFVFTGNTAAPDSGVSVFYASWYGALHYANWLSGQNGLEKVYTFGPNGVEDVEVDWNANGYRLPTDAEWEYAARGGLISRGYLYAGSNSVDDVAWYWDNSHYGDYAHAGGELKPNELNLYDMSGNISEYCWDWVAYSYNYSRHGQTNPMGPAKEEVVGYNTWGRTIRGGDIGDRGDQLFWFETTFPYVAYSDVPIISGGIRLVRRGEY